MLVVLDLEGYLCPIQVGPTRTCKAVVRHGSSLCSCCASCSHGCGQGFLPLSVLGPWPSRTLFGALLFFLCVVSLPGLSFVGRHDLWPCPAFRAGFCDASVCTCSLQLLKSWGSPLAVWTSWSPFPFFLVQARSFFRICASHSAPPSGGAEGRALEPGLVVVVVVVFVGPCAVCGVKRLRS